MTLRLLFLILLTAVAALQSLSEAGAVDWSRNHAGRELVSGAVQRTYLFAPDAAWMSDTIVQRQGGTYHYYHNDHLGTPRKLTNNVGGVTWSARYSAYGVADVTASGADNPLRFPGQYSDPESGLYYNYQRNYDPELGVYAEQDPYGVAWTGPNRHLYANGEPGLGFDPTGEIVPAWVIWSGVTFLASEAYSGFPTFRCFQYLSDDCLYAQNAEFCIDAAIGAATGIGVGVAARGMQALRVASTGVRRARATTDIIATPNGLANVRSTLDRIRAGAKHPHRNDGSVFGNKEGKLPIRPEGYYREYVHPTPGIQHAGKQRIITGQDGDLYYSPDHYETFIPLN